MRELSLDRLRTLVTIADLGSFAEAARTLHLAPPTVSLHIADLEAQVGAPLLVRKRGEVHPSGVGEVLVERARRLLADADEAMDSVQRQVQGLAAGERGAHAQPRAAVALPIHVIMSALDLSPGRQAERVVWGLRAIASIGLLSILINYAILKRLLAMIATVRALIAAPVDGGNRVLEVFQVQGLQARSHVVAFWVGAHEPSQIFEPVAHQLRLA